MANYRVSIADPAFPAQSRRRAGIVVHKKYGFEGVLTDEQLEAIRNDGQLRVEEVSAQSAPVKQPKSKKGQEAK